MQTSVIVSDDIDSKDAAKEICEKIKKDGREPAALMLFAGIDHEHQAAIDTFYKAFPNIVLTGGTTDGEMANGEFRQDSLSVCCFWKEPGVNYDVVGIEKVDNANIKTQVDAALKNLVGGLKAPLKLVVQTSGGLNVNSGGVMAAANDIVSKAGGIIVGATTGDQFRFKKTVEFINKKAVNDGASFLLISGNVNTFHDTAFGWKPVGEFHTITKAVNNVIEEIDGKPVVQFYNDLLSIDKGLDNAAFMQAITPFPLAIYDNDENFSLRTPLVRLPDNKILYAGEVRQGAKMKYTKVNKEDLLQGIVTVAEKCKREAKFQPKFAVLFSCTTRCQLLGTDVGREVSNFKKVIGDKVDVIGFYGYGEMAPYAGQRDCHFHNNTLTVTLVG